MPDYLQTIYFRDESDASAYPQKLCDHIVSEYFSRTGPVAAKRVLDVGSGKGNHLLAFSRSGLTPYGLDKRPECIHALDGFEIKACDIETDPFPYDDEFFDFVYSKSVLEHVKNTDNFLSQAYRVLRPGAMALFLTPDWKSQSLHFWDDYTHVKPFTRKSLQDAMLINGYTNVECAYFLQLPFVWKCPWTTCLTRIIALLPDSLKWRDKEERHFRTLVRFSKEKMLLGMGYKPNGRAYPA